VLENGPSHLDQVARMDRPSPTFFNADGLVVVYCQLDGAEKSLTRNSEKYWRGNGKASEKRNPRGDD